MSENEIAVAAVDDIADGDYRIFAIDATEVGVFRVGDKILAYENVCPHAGGPVCQGQIFNRVEEPLTPDKKSLGLRFSARRNIVCPWHGYEFDIETGCHPGDRAMALKRVKVDVRGGQIFVMLAE
jgi:nitrite reductase/ring-hydroxylating ferredoxin subunit